MSRTSVENLPAPPNRQQPRRLVTSAVVVASIGALCVALAPIVGVGRTGRGTEMTGPLWSAALVSALCVLAVPLVAALNTRRRPEFSAALLAGLGASAIGALVLDLQLFVGAIDANRLELFRPASTAAIEPGVGAYMTVLGHGLLVLSGALGLAQVYRESERDGYGDARVPEFVGRSVGARIGGWAGSAAALAAIGFVLALFGPAFTSSDPIFLARPLVDSPVSMAVGAALLGAAVLVVTASALTAVSALAGSGALIGVGVGALNLGGTRAAAGLTAGDRIGVGTGSTVAAACAVIIVVVGIAVPALAIARESRVLAAKAPIRSNPPTSKRAVRDALAAESAAARARGRSRHRIAGVGGVTTAALAVLGTVLPLLTLPDGISSPSISTVRIVILAAVVLMIPSVGLFVSRLAPTVRPVVGVVWTAVAMGIGAVLQSVAVATDVPGVGVGAGALVLGVAAVCSALTGLAVASAGSAERDDVDTSSAAAVRLPVLIVGGAGAAAVLIGTALPLYRGVDYTAPSVLGWPWGLDTWGQLTIGIAAVGAAVVAAYARPVRAAALLCGSALAAAVYVAGWPLLSARVVDPTVGVGAITAGAGIVLSIVAAVLSIRARHQQNWS
ncbi:hypothetical protein ABH922_000678 [Rhodococcus sp. 27YEA15]|uniref:hypothetical protein n=1 Tax=Rhodococcus sp. 27YEA15 TaxID=3156259 RepID=UPI003C7D1821